jgi:EAL and modified HD-GYP domain-containing signal transduction protein
MSSPYFFFRPVINAERGWSALGWHTSSPETTKSDDLLRCFSDEAVESLTNLLPTIIPIEAAWLEQSAFLDKFDPARFVFVLAPEALDNLQILERCKQLKSRGYHLALHVDSANLVRRVPPNGFDYLHLGAAFARNELPGTDLVYASDAGFRKIATEIDSHEMFDWLSGKGFDLFDCHFLTRRNPLFGKEPDLTRLKLLKLLTLVERDGNTHDIEEIFRQEPKLSYNLLRLVNSVAVGARTRISSFSQAIAILGRRQLQRWLQLLIYANNLADGNAPNPLMQLAAARGRQMEILIAAIEPKPDLPDLADKAFLTGMFSLLDVLVNIPINEILKELPLHEEVATALKTPQLGGVLGQLLLAVMAEESSDFSTAESLLAKLGISPEKHAKAQASALFWAARINVDSDN